MALTLPTTINCTFAVSDLTCDQNITLLFAKNRRRTGPRDMSSHRTGRRGYSNTVCLTASNKKRQTLYHVAFVVLSIGANSQRQLEMLCIIRWKNTDIMCLTVQGVIVLHWVCLVTQRGLLVKRLQVGSVTENRWWTRAAASLQCSHSLL